MPASWNRNRLTAKLGIDHPIIQGPFGGLSGQRLTAAVSKRTQPVKGTRRDGRGARRDKSVGGEQELATRQARECNAP